MINEIPISAVERAKRVSFLAKQGVPTMVANGLVQSALPSDNTKAVIAYCRGLPKKANT